MTDTIAPAVPAMGHGQVRTARTARMRCAQYAMGGRHAGRIFSVTGPPPRLLARAVRLREDLMLGGRVFNSKEPAVRAEGLLARMIEARGYPTYSDFKDLADLREQLRQLRMDDRVRTG